MILENTSKLNIVLSKGDVTSKMDVFYNPLMESNRNIAILVLNSMDNTEKNIALPLAGSGIRAIRVLKEVRGVNHIFVNDKKNKFVETFNSNLKLNELNSKKISIFNEEASLFMLNRISDKDKPAGFCGYFDYIDIDPFGSPNTFISAAIARISRNGIIAITATDTAALTGTYPNATRRKYWAETTKNYLMHELGLRILIRKVQLQGAQFDKALVPVLSYHKDHYFRIFFKSLKGKENCDGILKQHQYLLYNHKTLEFEVSALNSKKGYVFIGPLWTGKLSDKELLNRMIKLNIFESENKLLDVLLKENDLVGFFDLHAICKRYKKDTPKVADVLKKTKGSKTHFSPHGIKTDKNIKEIVKLLK